MRSSNALRKKVRPRLTPDSRVSILRHLADRDGAHCHYCHCPFPAATLAGATLDHYVPVVLWPTNKPRNLVLACGDCNTVKAAALPPVLALLLAAQSPDSPPDASAWLASADGRALLLALARRVEAVRRARRRPPLAAVAPLPHPDESGDRPAAWTGSGVAA
ncbi:HNH endonuclease signature motif containing protein [Streptomyces sp. NPDC004959]|uniref:HNH endonuclease n=1 Tax=Streptomyces sp. NPDC004959 TaxID=3154673 RepID=UPI0033B5ED09